MKLTAKDKNLLTILLAIVILFASVYVTIYIINPKKEEVDKEIVTLQQEYDLKKDAMSRKDQYVADTAEFNKKYNKYVNLYKNEITQEEQIRFAKSFESSTKIQVDSLTFTPLTDSLHLQSVDDKTGNSQGFYKSSVAFPVNTSVDKYISALKFIQNFKTKSRLASLSFDFNREDGSVTSNFEVEQFCIKANNGDVAEEESSEQQTSAE